MDPEDYIKLAKDILENEKLKYPAAYRTVISRVYYAAFNYGIQSLYEMGFVLPRNAASHEKIKSLLNYSGNIELRGVKESLNTLRKVRNKADYNDDNVLFKNRDTSISYLAMAEDAIQIIKDVFSGPERENIKNAIQEINSTTQIAHVHQARFKCCS